MLKHKNFLDFWHILLSSFSGNIIILYAKKNDKDEDNNKEELKKETKLFIRNVDFCK